MSNFDDEVEAVHCLLTLLRQAGGQQTVGQLRIAFGNSFSYRGKIAYFNRLIMDLVQDGLLEGIRGRSVAETDRSRKLLAEFDEWRGRWELPSGL